MKRSAGSVCDGTTNAGHNKHLRPRASVWARKPDFSFCRAATIPKQVPPSGAASSAAKPRPRKPKRSQGVGAIVYIAASLGLFMIAYVTLVQHPLSHSLSFFLFAPLLPTLHLLSFSSSLQTLHSISLPRPLSLSWTTG